MGFMQNQNKIRVIGIGPKGETFYREYILSADIIVGGKRLLNFFNFNKKQETIILAKNLQATLENLKSVKNKNIVILASGDPLFFGIGKRLVEIFGKDNLIFHPYLNSIQILAAKIGIDYSNIIYTSFHGRNFNENRLLSFVKYNEKVGILTDKNNNINKIVNSLKNSYLPTKDITVHIGQMLGTTNENIISSTVDDYNWVPPTELDSIIIVNKKIENFYHHSLAEKEIYHFEGLITKKEIRAISISYLNLSFDSIMWDIGGGSGSVSIEASSLCYKGMVYIIEKELERVKLIEKNLKKFRCHNVKVISGNAEDVMKQLPIPNRVFIGGFSGNIENLLDYLKTIASKNIIVVLNIVLIEKLYSVIKWCQKNNIEFESCQVNVSNLNNIAEKFHYYKAQNPVNIIKLILE